MSFLQDELEVGDGVNTITETSHTAKRRKTKHMEEETKMELWKAALQVLKSPSQDPLNTMCSHLQDPDEQWLLSLAPQLKSLTMQQKSLVKLRIQTAMHEVAYTSNSENMFRYVNKIQYKFTTSTYSNLLRILKIFMINWLIKLQCYLQNCKLLSGLNCFARSIRTGLFEGKQSNLIALFRCFKVFSSLES